MTDTVPHSPAGVPNPASDRRSAMGDLVLGLVMLGLAGAFLWESIGLPESDFETQGPAAVPRGICLVIAVCALIISVNAVRRLANGANATGPRAEIAFSLRPGLTGATLLASTLYVLAMALELLSFRVSTVFYVLVLGAVLTGFERRRLLVLLILALILGIGGQYVFTQVFTVDLP